MGATKAEDALVMMIDADHHTNNACVNAVDTETGNAGWAATTKRAFVT